MTIAERVARLEEIVGKPDGDGVLDLVTMVAVHQEKLEGMHAAQEELVQDLVVRSDHQRAEQSENISGILERIQGLEDEVKLLRKALVNGAGPSSSNSDQSSKVKVPDPKVFNGNRDAKELENFIWDLENYFKAMGIPEMNQVNLATMYLGDDAKLWWRTRVYDDLSSGRPKIESWEQLKR